MYFEKLSLVALEGGYLNNSMRHTCVSVVRDVHLGILLGRIVPDGEVLQFWVVHSFLRVYVDGRLVFSRTVFGEDFMPV